MLAGVLLANNEGSKAATRTSPPSAGRFLLLRMIPMWLAFRSALDTGREAELQNQRGLLLGTLGLVEQVG